MKKLLVPMLLAGLISACAGSHVKDTPKAEASAPVVQTQSPVASSVVTAAETAKLEINPLKDPNNILSKRSIYFDFDQYKVKPEYKALVEAHAKYLVSHPNASIRIEGNTDDRGTREYNVALGQKRAVAVKKVLNVDGAQDKQIETISYGKEKPKSEGENEAAWEENRRADIIYSGE